MKNEGKDRDKAWRWWGSETITFSKWCLVMKWEVFCVNSAVIQQENSFGLFLGKNTYKCLPKQWPAQLLGCWEDRRFCGLSPALSPPCSPSTTLCRGKGVCLERLGASNSHAPSLCPGFLPSVFFHASRADRSSGVPVACLHPFCDFQLKTDCPNPRW